MPITTALTLQDAPRDAEALMGQGTYTLKSLAKQLNLHENSGFWSGFLASTKERMVEEIVTALRVFDENHKAPAQLAAPDQTPAAPPAAPAAAAAEKPVRTPSHNGKAKEAPNGGTGKLVAEGPTGGDFLMLTETLRKLTETSVRMGGQLDTLATRAPEGPTNKELAHQIAVTQEMIFNLGKVLMLVMERQMGMERADAVSEALEDPKGTKELFPGYKPGKA